MLAVIVYEIPKHVHPLHFPAFVALAMRLPGLSSVKLCVASSALEISLHVSPSGDLISESALRAELAALAQLDDCFCPCGCGAVVVFNACFQSDPVQIDGPYGLTPQERESVLREEAIAAIKSVRQRTGMGLRDAKDHVDRARNLMLAAGLRIPGWDRAGNRL